MFSPSAIVLSLYKAVFESCGRRSLSTCIHKSAGYKLSSVEAGAFDKQQGLDEGMCVSKKKCSMYENMCARD